MVRIEPIDVGSANLPTDGHASVTPVLDDPRLRLWPIILMAIGAAMVLMAVGLFLRERMEDEYPIVKSILSAR